MNNGKKSDKYANFNLFLFKNPLKWSLFKMNRILRLFKKYLSNKGPLNMRIQIVMQKYIVRRDCLKSEEEVIKIN
jgi:hypothetical protein